MVESLLLIALVLFIVLPIIGMALDKAWPLIVALFTSLFYLALFVGAVIGLVVLYRALTRHNEELAERRSLALAELDKEAAEQAELERLRNELANAWNETWAEQGNANQAARRKLPLLPKPEDL